MKTTRNELGISLNRRRSPSTRVLSVIVCVHLVLQAFVFRAGAQERPGMGTGRGLAEVVEAIEQARVVTRVLYIDAHPDDESGAVLAWLARGAHADVALLSLTRGEGGQNALGPEQAPQLGLLRTEELLTACRYYGVKLYFGGAQDFGFTKTPEEALQVWGEPVLANMVRVIREFRPHIILNNWGGVRTGHGQHQASGILTPQAMEAAADPAKFSGQLREGLRPWRTPTLLQHARGAFPGATAASQPAETLQIPGQSISPLWGKSYNEIGVDGYTQHRTQGVATVGNSPFFRGPRAVVLVGGTKVTLEDFSRQLAGITTSPQAQQALAKANLLIGDARASVLQLHWNGAATALAQAALLLREIQAGVTVPDLLFDVQAAMAKIDRALAMVAGMRVTARADRGEITPGSSFTVRAEWTSRPTNIQWSSPEMVLPEGWQVTKTDRPESGPTQFTVAVPGTAQPQVEFRMGISPWPAPLAGVQFTGRVEGYQFHYTAEVEAQLTTTTRLAALPLVVVPAVTLTPEPAQFVIPAGAAAKPVEVVVRIHYYGTSPGEIRVGLEPAGQWRITAPIVVKFSGPGDQLVKFGMTPAGTVQAGEHSLSLWAQLGDARYASSLEPLPTLPTRLWSKPANVALHAFDLKVPATLRVGYVASESDPIPAALQQIGVQVDLLDENALAFGDLSKYDAIAVGIRAYELRQDLIRANPRLLDYAAAGGTLLVQYQRESIWDSLKPAPYPAVMNPPRNDDSSPFRNSPRVTMEDAPVKILAASHPVLNFPNKISAADFNGWVQERGLSFWTKFDARYVPLLAMNDPGEPESNGSLVIAQHGKGLYIYTGLSLFRQVPAGVPGSFRLLVNLLSQSKQRTASKK